MGDSRTPVFFLVAASLLNIGLDFLLVLVIPMGVAGTAWATVISQAVSGLGCFLFILKKMPLLHVGWEDLKPRPRYMKRLCGMGSPWGCRPPLLRKRDSQTSVNGLLCGGGFRRPPVNFPPSFPPQRIPWGSLCPPTPGRISAPASRNVLGRA
ncbi:MAG: polysaccharide biosynthesis C-terminal domain-containing protein [Eubacteriales bacterium]